MCFSNISSEREDYREKPYNMGTLGLKVGVLFYVGRKKKEAQPLEGASRPR